MNLIKSTKLILKQRFINKNYFKVIFFLFYLNPEELENFEYFLRFLFL